VVQFPKFFDIYEIGHGEVKSEVDFYTGSSLMAVSAHAQYKWPKWLKARPKLKLCTNQGAENLILYNINARRTTVVVSAHTK